MANFLAELKRRHVYRLAAAYAVVAWIQPRTDPQATGLGGDVGPRLVSWGLSCSDPTRL